MAINKPGFYFIDTDKTEYTSWVVGLILKHLCSSVNLAQGLTPVSERSLGGICCDCALRMTGVEFPTRSILGKLLAGIAIVC